MCGICGFTSYDKELLRKMGDSIKHRGPDDKGEYFDDNISLGHRRLSIVDLTEKGKQPMSNEDGAIWITYNGEIYNYKNLRQRLYKHKFRSETDTEVIIHAYEEYGMDFVSLLDGMFAFAIWDSNHKRLTLARDRLGKKPLYYLIHEGKVYFASEMKALMHVPFKHELDMQSLYNYFSFRYVPEPDTLLSGIKKVAPAHFLVFESGSIKTNQKYWGPSFSRSYVNEKVLAEDVLNLLRESVRKRLMGEVPYGVFLSGGLDSSAITSLISSMTEEPVKTFSIGYNLPNFEDELKIAKKVADYFNTDHEEVVMDSSAAGLLKEVVWHMDEPIADMAAIPNYILSKEAKKKVTVILMGEGADEVFGGYEQYKIMNLAFRYKSIPRIFRNFGMHFVSKLPPKVLDKYFQYSSSLGEEGIKRAKDFFVKFHGDERDYTKIVSVFSEEEKQNLLGTVRQDSHYAMSGYFKEDCLTHSMQHADLRMFLSHLLMKVDKTTMAHAVEARAPYLDTGLVDFACRIDPTLKVGKKEKYILAKACSKILPEFVLKRKKQRFFVPLHIWFDGELMGLAEEKLLNNNFFNKSYVKKAMENYSKSRLYYTRQFWTMLTFTEWQEQFLKEV